MSIGIPFPKYVIKIMLTKIYSFGRRSVSDRQTDKHLNYIIFYFLQKKNILPANNELC